MPAPTPLSATAPTDALEAFLQANARAELWLDDHPGSFAPWADRDHARFRLDPRATTGLLSGATTNPRLLVEAVRAGVAFAEPLAALVSRAGRDVERLTRLLRDEAVRHAAHTLRPRFDATNGRSGWVSAQVDPTLVDADAMTRDGEHLASLAPNVMVKVPATEAGLAALERLTQAGVATNTTLSTTAAQARAALDAFAGGFARARVPPRRAVLTFMVGRLGAALHDAHAATLLPGDERRVELLALETQHALVEAAGLPMQLLVCSLRADDHDLAVGTTSTHLGAAVGRPWVLTCPIPFLVRATSLPALPARIVVAEADTARLSALPAVRAALHPDALSPSEFDAWPALVANRAEHVAARHGLTAFARAVLESA